MVNKMNLTEALKKYFGFDKFKGDQERIIQNLLDGNDTFVLMPTGGGKVALLSTAVAVDGGYGHCHLASHRPDEEPGRRDNEFK